MVNKKGISDIVATVLLVLITIAAIGVVYGTVMPLIRQSVETSQKCSELKVEVKTEAGYTCYTAKEVQMQVARGTSDVNMTGLQLQISGEGTSKTLKLYGGVVSSDVRALANLTYGQAGILPGKNEMVTYAINSSSPNVNMKSFEKVAAAPIIKVGAKEILCDMPVPTAISACTY